MPNTHLPTERRLSSPEYREMVHRRAVEVTENCGGDHEDAAEYATHAANELRDEWSRLVWQDVATLLTRRALTVAGVPGGES